MRRITSLLAACLLTVTVTAGEAALPTRAEVKTLIDGGTAWVKAQQREDGSFAEGPFALGITELSVLALLENGTAKDDPAVAKGVAYILKFVNEDGGIYDPNLGLKNYCTSLGLMALLAAGYDDQAVIGKAQKALLGMQNVDDESINDGGIGYGSRGQGNEDLINTVHAQDALLKAGVKPEDPAMQRMLKFLERCQNLSSHNDQEWAKNGPQDGGGVYSPDSSKAGTFYEGDETPKEKPAEPTKPGKAVTQVSYGTATYALISGYLALELKPDDPRVAAALGWVKKNYRIDANPGLPQDRAREGLFYQYVLMAKTFDLLDMTEIEVEGKGTVDWRADMYAVVKAEAQQVADQEGQLFWINSAPRWGEGFPGLTTAYTLRALARLQASLPEGK